MKSNANEERALDILTAAHLKEGDGVEGLKDGDLVFFPHLKKLARKTFCARCDGCIFRKKQLPDWPCIKFIDLNSDMYCGFVEIS